MISVPIAIVIFVLGIVTSLVGYIWSSLGKKISRIEKRMEAINFDVLMKCAECDPLTIQQIKELFDARFNEFRLELYKSGVLKPQIKKKTSSES